MNVNLEHTVVNIYVKTQMEDSSVIVNLDSIYIQMENHAHVSIPHRPVVMQSF